MGKQHQAGSDALLTLKCYHELCKKFEGGKVPRKMVNRVFGLGTDFHSNNVMESNFELEAMNGFFANNFYFQNNYATFGTTPNPAAPNYFMNGPQQNYYYYPNQQPQGHNLNEYLGSTGY